MVYNSLSALQANIHAIETAVNLISDNKIPTQDDLKILNNFTGWGGIKAILYPIDVNWTGNSNISSADLKLEETIKNFHKFITANENLQQLNTSKSDIWSSIKESVLTSFYTPEPFIFELFKKLKETNPYINSMLDPSSGSGRFVDGFLNFYPEAKITAVEKDFLTSLILQAKYIGNENVTIINKGFEEVKFGTQKFDVVSSNIPFGNFKVNFSAYDNKITDKIHNFFFYHGQNLLNEGGLLMYLTSSGVFNSPNNQYIREEIAKRTNLRNLISMPNNLHNNTQVTAHLFVAEKNTQHFNNQHFTKTITDENNINVNEFLYNNASGYLIDKEHIKIDKNPYGDLEYNYQMPLENIVEQLDNEIDIPNLNIKRAEETEHEVLCDRYPIGFEKLQNLSFKRELDLLRIDIPETDERNFNVIAAIKANYMGTIIPIATISKLLDVNNNGKYLIDSYIQNQTLYKPERKLITSKEFVQEFDNLFLPSLTDFAKKFNLKIEVETKDNEAGKNFKKYLFEKFSQPYIDINFQYELNTLFHRAPEVDMLIINEFGNPARIKNITIDKNEKILYELQELETLISNPRNRVLLKDYILLYDTYNTYNQALKNKNDNTIRIYNQKLNQNYDDFVKKYGYINDNQHFIKQFDKFYFPILSTLENKSEEQTIDLFTSVSAYSKADIFKLEQGISEKLSVQDALFKSLGSTGRIDLIYIQKISETDEDAVLQELADKIIYNPISAQYELREIFLSGNVIEKIKEIEILPADEVNKQAIEELKKVIPEQIPYFSIQKQFGSRWIPIEIYKDFVRQFYETNFRLNYNENTDLFLVEKVEDWNKGAKYITHKCVNNRTITPESIIENAFNNIYPIVKYTIGEKPYEETKVDFDATNFYKHEITKLRNSFDNYLATIDENQKENLSKIYNEKFNNVVLYKPDGSFLNFDEFDFNAKNIKDIYQHQKDAVWKTVTAQGGVIDHEVGLGKTLTLIAQSHFLKKFGICKKPIIIGLKANVGEIADTYSKLLPNSKILFATEKDYQTENREKFLNSIKNNNWDAVIMSHEQFEKIPQSLEIQLEIAEKELEDVNNNLFAVEGMEISKAQLKGLEIKKKNLTAHLNYLIATINARKDLSVLSFENLGIDHIIVDESHQFKNLAFQTRHTRVAGLGNSEGSQRASNLLTAIRTLQQNTPSGEMGATFYSGTPISNSLTELFLLHKYLTPRTLAWKGISNFDSWAANFAKKSSEFEVNMVGDIISKERFRYFINLPELAGMYCNIAHVMNGDVAGIDRPQKNETLLLNEQTPLQKYFYQKLAKFLKDGEATPLKLEKEVNVDAKSTAISLVAMNLAFKASLDMRLINSSLYKDEKNSKINKLVENTLEYYNNFGEQKGTQIIFCDISTPKQNLSFQELEENYQNNTFTTLYDDIKYKLIKGGVKESEIAFVQNFNSQKKKDMLADKMNKGEIRVLIGGTQNAGTGLNVQKRLCSIKHLTIPWKPSELDQRNGRGFRQGNWLAKVFNDNKIDIQLCATTNTLDSYKVDLNKNKAQFISQIKNYSLGYHVDRTADEGMLDENAGMNLAEFHAQITGDTTLLDKFKIDKKIKELELEKSFVLNEVGTAKNKIATAEKRIAELEQIISYCTADLSAYKGKVQYDDKGTRINKPNYIGLEKENPTEKEILEFLKNKHSEYQQMDSYQQAIVAEMYDFQLIAQNNFIGGVTYAIRDKENPKVHYEITSGKINFTDEKAASSYFMRCFDAIQRKIDGNQKEIEQKRALITEQTKKLSFTFDKDLELANAQNEALHLEAKLNNNQKKEFKLSHTTKQGKAIDIIPDVETFERAMANGILGKENATNYILTSQNVIEILEQLVEQENSQIEILYNRPEQDNLNLISFEMKDYDKLYIDYLDLKEREIQAQYFQEIEQDVEKPKLKL